MTLVVLARVAILLSLVGWPLVWGQPPISESPVMSPPLPASEESPVPNVADDIRGDRSAAVPPPANELSANCDSPTYASDQLVCEDEALRAIDAQYQGMLVEPVGLAQSALFEDGSVWFRRRSLCAFETDHRRCLLQAYEDRIASLEAGLRPVDGARWQRLRCNGAWKGLAVRVDTTEMQQRITFRDDTGVLVVATLSSKASLWQPFVSYERRGRKIALHTLDGGKIICRP